MPYSLLTKYTSDTATNLKAHKEYVCMSSASEESYMRPPLWEDITSSIQNIDPENAIMLGGAVATHVKLEASDNDQYIEDLSTAPLLSPLEIKPELKSQHATTQIYVSAPANSTQHPHPHHHHHHPSQQNHQPIQSTHSLYLNGIISNSSTNTGRLVFSTSIFFCFFLFSAEYFFGKN